MGGLEGNCSFAYFASDRKMVMAKNVQNEKIIIFKGELQLNFIISLTQSLTSMQTTVQNAVFFLNGTCVGF